MPRSKKLTTEELIVFERLMIANRDSAKLQKITDYGYTESIGLINKIRRILGR